MSQIKLVAKKGAALNIIMILMMMMMMSVKPFRHHSTSGYYKFKRPSQGLLEFPFALQLILLFKE